MLSSPVLVPDLVRRRSAIGVSAAPAHTASIVDSGVDQDIDGNDESAKEICGSGAESRWIDQGNDVVIDEAAFIAHGAGARTQVLLQRRQWADTV